MDRLQSVGVAGGLKKNKKNASKNFLVMKLLRFQQVFKPSRDT